MSAVTIEETREILIVNPIDDDGLKRKSVLALCTRPSDDVRANIDMRALLRTALRLRPDIITMAEMRGAEALDAQEAALLFLSDLYGRITPYVKRLRGFEKVFVPAGAAKRLRFVLDARDFSFINESMRPEVEPGGNSSMKAPNWVRPPGSERSW